MSSQAVVNLEGEGACAPEALLSSIAPVCCHALGPPSEKLLLISTALNLYQPWAEPSLYLQGKSPTKAPASPPLALVVCVQDHCPITTS